MSAEPRSVRAILDWPGTWFLARLALVSAYLIGGVTKLIDFSGAIAEHEHFGLYPGGLWAGLTIIVELGASLLLLSGRMVWFAAGALGVFTGLAALLANAFWTMPESQARFMAMNSLFEHVGLIGGFMLAALVADRMARA